MTRSHVTPDINPYSSQAVEPAPRSEAPVRRTEHIESLLTRMIEHQTAKVPSSYFLFASLCAMAVSLGAEMADRQRVSRFVGMWAGPLLTMGVYNKMVKTLGAR
jgi:hypothetical protein